MLNVIFQKLCILPSMLILYSFMCTYKVKKTYSQQYDYEYMYISTLYIYMILYFNHYSLKKRKVYLETFGLMFLKKTRDYYLPFAFILKRACCSSCHFLNGAAFSATYLNKPFTVLSFRKLQIRQTLCFCTI